MVGRRGLAEQRFEARVARNTELRGQVGWRGGREQVARERSRVVAHALPSPAGAHRWRSSTPAPTPQEGSAGRLPGLRGGPDIGWRLSRQQVTGDR